MHFRGSVRVSEDFKYLGLISSVYLTHFCQGIMMYNLLCFLRQCLKYFKERVTSELFRASKRGNPRPHRLPHYQDMLQLEADKSTLHNSRLLGGKT